MNTLPPVTFAVVDDHAYFRESLAKFINSKECKFVMDAKDGADFLHKLSIATTIPDVCLLDISMPNLNGYETMKILSRDWPDIYVIAITMYGETDTILDIIAEGARGFILKGSSAIDIKKAIIEVYETGFCHSKLVSHNLLIKSRHWKPILSGIPPREMEFLNHCCSDLKYAEIGKKMGVADVLLLLIGIIYLKDST